MMDKKKREITALGVVETIENIVGTSMFFMMIILLTFNVCSWLFFKKRYGQLEEAVTACLVWVSYINMGSHYIKKQHIRVDFLLTKLSPKGQKIADVINDVAVLIIGVFILYFGWKLMWKSTNKYTGVLKICYFWIDLGLVLGFASMIFLIVLKYIPRKKKKEVVA